MSSIRDRLIDAVHAALDASTPAGPVTKPTGLLVLEERTHPTQTDALPAIILYFDDDEPEPLAGVQFKAPITRKMLGVTLEYRALASVSGAPVLAPRKAIDPLYLWAWQQIGTDETFGGVAMGVTEGKTKWLSAEGEEIVAAAAQKITIHYRTSRLNPSTTS